MSLNDPPPPKPEELGENGSGTRPLALFGRCDAMFAALLVQRLHRDGPDPELYIDRMTRAYFNRGTMALPAGINDIHGPERLILWEGSS